MKKKRLPILVNIFNEIEFKELPVKKMKKAVENVLDQKNIGNAVVNIILMSDSEIHKINNERIYITHGDQFDGYIIIHPFLYWLGDNAYELSIKINKVYNFFRKIFGYDYWSLSQHLKDKVKNVIQFIGEYKKWSELKLKEVQCDSILMGHTHSAKVIKKKYYNTGDFVESCTYLIEDYKGEIILNQI